MVISDQFEMSLSDCLFMCLLLMLPNWLSRGQKEGGEEGDWFGSNQFQGWEFWGMVFWGLFLSRKDIGVGVFLVYCLCTWVALLYSLIRLIYKKNMFQLCITSSIKCALHAWLHTISHNTVMLSFPSFVFNRDGFSSETLRFIHISMGKLLNHNKFLCASYFSTI